MPVKGADGNALADYRSLQHHTAANLHAEKKRFAATGYYVFFVAPASFPEP